MARTSWLWILLVFVSPLVAHGETTREDALRLAGTIQRVRWLSDNSDFPNAVATEEVKREIAAWAADENHLQAVMAELQKDPPPLFKQNFMAVVNRAYDETEQGKKTVALLKQVGFLKLASGVGMKAAEDMDKFDAFQAQRVPEAETQNRPMRQKILNGLHRLNRGVMRGLLAGFAGAFGLAAYYLGDHLGLVGAPARTAVFIASSSLSAFGLYRGIYPLFREKLSRILLHDAREQLKKDIKEFILLDPDRVLPKFVEMAETISEPLGPLEATIYEVLRDLADQGALKRLRVDLGISLRGRPGFQDRADNLLDAEHLTDIQSQVQRALLNLAFSDLEKGLLTRPIEIFEILKKYPDLGRAEFAKDMQKVVDALKAYASRRWRLGLLLGLRNSFKSSSWIVAPVGIAIVAYHALGTPLQSLAKGFRLQDGQKLLNEAFLNVTDEQLRVGTTKERLAYEEAIDHALADSKYVDGPLRIRIEALKRVLEKNSHDKSEAIGDRLLKSLACRRSLANLLKGDEAPGGSGEPPASQLRTP